MADSGRVAAAAPRPGQIWAQGVRDVRLAMARNIVALRLDRHERNVPDRRRLYPWLMQRLFQAFLLLPFHLGGGGGPSS